MLSIRDRSSKRVLVYRLGSLGDTVIALPLFHLIARAFPDAERRMLTSYPPHVKAPPSSSILEGTGLIHGYYRYTYATRNLKELAALWWSLVRWRPQVLVYMGGPRGVTTAKRDSLFFRLCGIRTQIGLPLEEDMQNHRTRDGAQYRSPYTAGLPLEHECSRLARTLAELGDASLDSASSWDLHLTIAEKKKAKEVLQPLGSRPFIAASVGTKMQSKDWGRNNWATLVARLAYFYPSYALVLCGAREESETSDFVAEAWRTRSDAPAVNLCGLLTPRESAAVFAKAVLFIGHDSGPMHLAAAVQIPCVAVFSSRNLPRVWFPYGDHHRVIYHNVDCQNCNLETCTVQQKKCILSFTVDEVLNEILLQLPRSSD
jgi:heptosyltransferase-3